MSSLSRTLPRVLRPAFVPSRSFHQSARQLDNTPPPTHRVILVDMDRVPTGISSEPHPSPKTERTLYAVSILALASVVYAALPKDWAGNLGYTAKEKEQQKKQKEQEQAEH